LLLQKLAVCRPECCEDMDIQNNTAVEMFTAEHNSLNSVLYGVAKGSVNVILLLLWKGEMSSWDACLK